MRSMGPTAFRQLGAMLCIALALMFAGTVVSSAVDQVQHAVPVAGVHDHSIFNLAIAIDDHDADHHADRGDPASQDEDAGNQPGHHHHADSGSGIPVFAAVSLARLPAARARLPLPAVRNLGSAAPTGPERPPRAAPIDV